MFSVLWSVLFSLSVTSGSGRIASIEITSSILPFHSIDSEKGDMNSKNLLYFSVCRKLVLDLDW